MREENQSGDVKILVLATSKIDPLQYLIAVGLNVAQESSEKKHTHTVLTPLLQLHYVPFLLVLVENSFAKTHFL